MTETERHRTPMGPLLLRAKNHVVQRRITTAVIREREGCSMQEVKALLDKTVLRRAVVDATTIDDLKQVLHEIINRL